jgi:hypothetical protein
LGEAQYFGISRLEEWLERKRYVDAVQLKCDFETHEDAESISGHYKTSPTDTIMEFHPSWGTRKIYICPRNIAVHRGNPWKCGRQCQNVQGDNPDTYDDEPTLRLFVVKKQVIVQHSVCIAQSDED